MPTFKKIPFQFYVLKNCYQSANMRNHRTVWAGRDFKAHATPIPTVGRAAPHQLRLPRAPSNLALSASRDGAPQLLWAAVPVPHHPLNERKSSQKATLHLPYGPL